ncbi:MAG: hypothetical protein WCF18_10490 [Chthoniobacteraceae bacterium]
MVGLAVEFSLVIVTFLVLWRRQERERRRMRERASQLNFTFLGDQGKLTNDQ